MWSVYKSKRPEGFTQPFGSELEQAANRQQKSKDRQWNSKNRANDCETDEHSKNHEHDTKNDGDESPGQFKDLSNQLPDELKRQ